MQTVRQTPGAENVAGKVAMGAPRPRDREGCGPERSVKAGLEAWSCTPRVQRPETGRGIEKGGYGAGLGAKNRSASAECPSRAREGRGQVPPRLVPAPILAGQVPETESLSRGLQEAEYELGQASGGGHRSTKRTSEDELDSFNGGTHY